MNGIWTSCIPRNKPNPEACKPSTKWKIAANISNNTAKFKISLLEFKFLSKKRDKRNSGKVMNNEITINANIMNEGFIDNLPSNCCVEVPCLINANGFMPQKIGKLPEQLTALMRTNINVQILTAEAALTKKREHIYHAAMLDPLTGANLTIDEIYDMTDKMIEAHGNYLPQYN